MDHKQNIKIEGYTNKWSAINTSFYNGQKVYLMENNTYGDETQALIIDENNSVIMDEVYNGFQDLEMLENNVFINYTK